MGYGRVIGLSVLLLMVVGVIVWMRMEPPRQVMPAVVQEYAPLVPENETPIPADDAFREECLASLRMAIPEEAYTAMLFTRSPTWGIVLRADYTLPDLHTPNVNRVVCSRNTDGKVRVNVSFGQKVPPLEPAK
ncbi:MAG: hypothetical protein LCH56_14655 [Proteobacteria bacterium]|nr:hypothetical protein [Pseudomonadota bacterium]